MNDQPNYITLGDHDLIELTMILECFHFVSLLSTLSRLMHENIFLQQKEDVSPISRVSEVSSGCSPITQDGKSRRAILEKIVQS